VTVPGSASKRLVETAPDLFREVEGPDTLLFRRDAEGRVTAASFGELPIYSYERLSRLELPSMSQALLVLCVALFGSAIVAMAGGAVLRRCRAGAAPSKLAGVARGVAGGTAVLQLVVLGGLVLVMGEPALLMDDFAHLRLVLALGLLSTALTGGLVVCTGLAWWKGLWSLPARLHYTSVSLAAIAFIWFLGRSNALGFQF
jgi:hypothetical protein